MMGPHEIALRDEQIALRVELVLAREKGGCPHAINALEGKIHAMEQQLKAKSR